MKKAEVKTTKKTKVKKEAIATTDVFVKYGGKAENTGSIEGQIAHFTQRIEHMSNHLKTNKQDFSTSRSLLNVVGQRKKLLKYLAARDIVKYRGLLEELNLRK